MKNFAFWYDGRLIEGRNLELAIDNPGLIYGATVFTTLRVYDSLDHPLTHWTEHQARLQSSLEAFDWLQPNWERVRHGADLLAAQFPVLRIVIFADGREWITGRYLPPDLAQRQQNGIIAKVAESHLQRSLPSHKTGNYLASWLALQQAQRSGAQEAILTDDTGNWLETSTGNLWGWRSGAWHTPPLQAGILPGILRNQLIHKLRWHNEEVIEKPWDAELIETFAAIAYTNCVMEVIPIHTILRGVDSRLYDPAHQSFQRLKGLFFT
ncbi:aminotransferase class IV [Phormidesmis priestleyi]|uniref:aminotransferase class IV n=1 Tax=Phormidesmis priestleyi TaxID=268141 RepID=UPI00083B7100|nr:aminotransferase class IV [Phormidesmis priestleyi]